MMKLLGIGLLGFVLLILQKRIYEIGRAHV